MNLPAALEALEQPVGLPPSLLKKAEEVRLENGPAKIEASIKSVQKLALRDRDLLEEVRTIYDLRNIFNSHHLSRFLPFRRWISSIARHQKTRLFARNTKVVSMTGFRPLKRTVNL